MCRNNPQTELCTVWGFTEEEVLHRWEIHQQFDPIQRLFGSDKKSKKSKPATDIPTVNSDAMHSLLNKLLEGD